MIKPRSSMVLVAMGFVLGAFCYAETPDLSLSDRIYQLEAETNILKEELNNVKKLAGQERASLFNPSISVMGDILGQYTIKGTHRHDGRSVDGHHHDDDNGLTVREFEIEFRGDIDPYATALLALAFHPHSDGEESHSVVHLEEAYLRLKKWPILDFTPLSIGIKAGIFKTAIGRMNRNHLHNIQQITFPLAMRRFLGNEGYGSQGISLDRTFAISSTEAISLFGEIVFLSRLPMQKEGAERSPSGILHAWWHQQWGSDHYFDLGLSGLMGRLGAEKSGPFALLGADIHYSYNPSGYGQNPLFLFGSETFAVYRGQKHWPIGNFTWIQTRLVGSSFLGIRYDLAPAEEGNYKRFQHAVGVYAGIYTSEFFRLRAGYELLMDFHDHLHLDHRMMVSMSFALGSHPVEPYFINR